MYQWWTVRLIRQLQLDGHGMKLGPVSILVYDWDGLHLSVCLLNRWSFDTGIKSHGGHYFHDYGWVEYDRPT